MSLLTPKSVQTLQRALHAKAKSDRGFRFYSLWDKVYRQDVLHNAYAKCRINGGSAGVDGQSFADIEQQGVEGWLGSIEQELKAKQYRPAPLLRVWIPKANGKQRPLGIPTIKDRVVQTAVRLVIEPIFEVDLLPNQLGFRPKHDAKEAIRRVYFHITQQARREIVDADLSDYFNTIPHGPLMKCVARRIVDKQLLRVIKLWLEAPVAERDGSTRGGSRKRTEAKDRHRGTPQGGVISPLLANLYFRRFILAWRKFGFTERYGAQIINYADDFVICTRPGTGPAVMEHTQRLMTALGLTLNGEKSRIVQLPDGKFDFLGYTFGQFYCKGGKPYLGTRPSKKSIRRVIQAIHEETSARWGTSTPEKRVLEVNRILRGWANYFNQGPVLPIYHNLQKYTLKRMRQWLVRKTRSKSKGHRRYPDSYFYEELGLLQLPTNRAMLTNAKA